MTRHLPTIALVFAFALASSSIVRTQEKAAAAPAAKASTPTTPLKFQIVISRYQGEKKISSLPYTLSVNAGYRGTLRMGAKVPVMMITAVTSPANGPDGKPTPLVGPIQYQDVGTNIDCNVSPRSGRWPIPCRDRRRRHVGLSRGQTGFRRRSRQPVVPFVPRK